MAQERAANMMALQAFVDAKPQELEQELSKCDAAVRQDLSGFSAIMTVDDESETIAKARRYTQTDVTRIKSDEKSPIPDEITVSYNICVFGSSPMGRIAETRTVYCQFRGSKYRSQFAGSGTPIPKGFTYMCDGMGL
jgi:hypothetical protein